MENLKEIDLHSRPRRSCVKKEENSKEKSYDFSDETESENDKQDSEYRLGGERKKIKKLKKKLKKKSNKPKREAPTYLSVIRAQKKFEAIHKDDTSDESIPAESFNSIDESIESDPVEEAPLPPPKKKKKIVIRPWNPQWYNLQQN